MFDQRHALIQLSNCASRVVGMRILVAIFLTFVALNILRATINCGLSSRDEVKKSCVIHQPAPRVEIGRAEEIKPLPMPNQNKIQEWVTLRLSNGTLTVRPNVRFGPGLEYETLARIRLGDVVEIVNQDSQWIQVRLLEPVLDGWAGWVQGRFVEDPEPEENTNLVPNGPKD